MRISMRLERKMRRLERRFYKTFFKAKLLQGGLDVVKNLKADAGGVSVVLNAFSAGLLRQIVGPNTKADCIVTTIRAYADGSLGVQSAFAPKFYSRSTLEYILEMAKRNLQKIPDSYFRPDEEKETVQ